MRSGLSMKQAWLTLLLMIAMTLAGCAGLGLQNEIDGLMKQGQQLYAEKKYDAAIDKFAEVVTKDPQYWQAYLWGARAFIAKGGWGGAIVNGKKAFELAPQGAEVVATFAEALFGAGSDALKNGRYAESIGHFFEFLKLEPGNARAWLNVGSAYLGQKQFREAFGALKQGLASSSGAERSELIRGLLDGGLQALSGGASGDAVNMLKEYIKHDAQNVSAYVNLAKAYWESGELGNAFDAYRNVLKLDPRQEDALRFLLGR